MDMLTSYGHIVASELKDPICHSNECQIGSFSSEATILRRQKKITDSLRILDWDSPFNSLFVMVVIHINVYYTCIF